MAQNYTRQSSFNDGDTISASLFNDEYNQLVNSFTYSGSSDSSTGHRHDGSAGQGGNIYRIGDLDFFNKIEADSVNNRWGVFVEVGGAAVEQVRIQDGAVVPVTGNDVDLGSVSLEFKDLYLDGTANIDSLVADTADINGGTIDGVTIGGSSAGVGTFTNLTATGTTILAGASTTADITFGDNDKAVFGAGSDLQIYHDGNHSYVSDQGTGSLRIQATDLGLETAAGNQNYLTGVTGGAVTLFHNGSAKLATTSTGIDVTGTVTADGLTVDGAAQFNTGATGIAEFYHVSGLGGVRITGSAGGSSSTLFLANDKSGGGYDIYALYGNGSNDSLQLYSGGTAGTGTLRSQFANNGDISFYEDTGTTPKFFWDAADETVSIGLGASSTATISAFSRTVSAGLPSALRIIENTGASTYWDIGADNGANPNLNFYVNANTTPKMTLASSGNVGIGTTSPTVALQVSGQIKNNNGYLIDNGTNAGFLTVDGSNVNFGSSTAAKGLAFFTAASSQAMTIDSSGRVGIGTSSPSHKLDVDSGSAELMVNMNTTNANGGYIRFQSSGTSIADVGTGGQIISGGSATDFGLNVRGANNLLFGTNTLERMRIDSSGNVGIGTSSPSYKLDVSGAFRSDSWIGRSNVSAPTADAAVYRAADNTLAFSTANTERMRIDSSGNVGIGSSSPGFVSGTGLEIQRTAATATVRLEYTGSNAFELSAEQTQVTYNSVSSLPHVFEIGSAEKMRLDASGNLLVGTSSADGDGLSIKPRASGGGTTTQLLFDRADTATAGFALVFHNNSSLVGSITYTNSATAYNTSSDARLKENIADAEDAGAKVDAIQVRQFDWKADGSHQDYGMVAQELLEVAPEAVSGDPESDDMMGVDYSKLVPMLVKEIQSLRARVAQLEGA